MLRLRKQQMQKVAANAPGLSGQTPLLFLEIGRQNSKCWSFSLFSLRAESQKGKEKEKKNKSKRE